MALVEDIKGDVIIRGSLTIEGSKLNVPAGAIKNAGINAAADIETTKMAQRALAEIPIPFSMFRRHNDLSQMLPTTAATPNLALDGHDAFGTSSLYLTTESFAGTDPGSEYARVLYPLPVNYDAGDDVKIRVHAWVNAGPANTTNTLDVEAYEANDEGGISADLVTTAAQTLTGSWADYDFVLTATALSPADVLDIRIHLDLDDTGGSGAITGEIGRVSLLADLRG